MDRLKRLYNQISGKFVVIGVCQHPLILDLKVFLRNSLFFLTYLRQDCESCQVPPILGPSASDGNNRSNQSHPNSLAAYFATPGFAGGVFSGQIAINPKPELRAF